MAYPLCKLPGVGDGGREKDIVNIVRKKNDGLLPNNSSLCKTKLNFGWEYFVWEKKKGKRVDKDGIRTHACRAQWISSPSP